MADLASLEALEALDTLDIEIQRGETVQLEEWEPAPWNPRELPEQRRRRLRGLLKVYGMVEDLVLDGDRGLVLGGNQRWDILVHDLEWEEGPATILTGLTEPQAKALNVALNAEAAQGEWDLPMLADVVREIDAGDVPAALTGLEATFLEDVLDGVPMVDPAEEDPPLRGPSQQEHKCPKCGYEW